MKKFLFGNIVNLMCIGLTLLALPACSTTQEPFHANPEFNPGKDDVLTPAEQNLMVESARQTVIAACKSKKLPSSVKNQVQTREPEVEIYYHGKKYGEMRVYWKLPRGANIVMTLRGELLTEKPRWRMGVRVTQCNLPLENSKRKR